jgi:hypothetical protein
VTLMLWVAAALVAIRFPTMMREEMSRPAPGFVAHYTAARLLADGMDVRRFYDDDFFGSAVARYEPTVRDIFLLPPTGALLMLPLVSLDYALARRIWIIVSIGCFAAAGGWLLASLGLRGAWIPLAVLLVLVFQPLHENLRHGQSYLMLFALLVVARQGEVGRRAASSGTALAAMLLFRFAAPFVWLELLLERRWLPLAWGGGVVLAVVLITLPWIGLEAWAMFPSASSAHALGPSGAITAYQTVTSFARHLFETGPFSPRPLYPSPVLAAALQYGGAFLLLSGAALVSLRGRNPDLSFSAFVVAGIVLSPFALDYHYLLALVPIAILAARLSRSRYRWPLVILALASALIAADLPYRSAKLIEGVWAILAYPKLCGAILLWALAVWTDLDDRSLTESLPR